MSTAAQILANQNNAKLSTGPRTQEGKAASSQNNLRHGLRGVFQVMPHESQAEFDALHTFLELEHEPVTYTEHILVDQMAQHEWRSRRTLGIIDKFMESGCEDHKLLAVWLRYQTFFTRSFHKCLADLLKLRAERRRDQIGFERQRIQAAAEARRQQTAEARNRATHAQAAAREVATAAKAARLSLPVSAINEGTKGDSPAQNTPTATVSAVANS